MAVGVDLSARTDHSSAPDSLRSVYLRLVAEERAHAREAARVLTPPS